MPSYEHKKQIEHILNIDKPPQEEEKFLQWIKADAHLNLLSENANSDEIIVYAAGPYSFIHSLLVKNDLLDPLDKNRLLNWNNCSPFTSTASYVYGGRRDDVWIDRENFGSGSEALNKGFELIYGRTFEGWSGEGRNYFEVNQEYTHLADIHWRPEHNAYCYFDENGDLVQAASITSREKNALNLVSFSWPKLEEYMAISNTSLVRMFDFTLLRRGAFSGWPNTPETQIDISPEFFYRQKIASSAAYTRGIQIIRTRELRTRIMENFKSGGSLKKSEEYVSFVAYDWRNKSISKISTDPKATTNYFEAEENSLPFELSPAFFRPEVLSKYKTDREKYKIAERDIQCRSAWSLQGYDLNEAGQVHAYICDLRDLPYSEQLHWLSYNEEPKTSISQRAYVNDFKGETITFQHPREEILSIVRGWNNKSLKWWVLRDENLLDHANPPLTSSKDEWANAFMDLSHLVVEGFQVKELREMLKKDRVNFESSEQSIRLLEKIINHTQAPISPIALDGLRKVQKIRSKVKGHAGSSEAKILMDEAIQEHESFLNHFKHICELVVRELEMIEKACG